MVDLKAQLLREAALERARERSRIRARSSLLAETAAPAGQVRIQNTLELGNHQQSHIFSGDILLPSQERDHSYNNHPPPVIQAMPLEGGGVWQPPTYEDRSRWEPTTGKWEPSTLPSIMYPSHVLRRDLHLPVKLAGELFPAGDLEADRFSIRPFCRADSKSRYASKSI